MSRTTSTTYVYLILDRNEEVIEAWGSKQAAHRRCLHLAGRLDFGDDWYAPPEGDTASVAKEGNPYQRWSWRKILLNR